MAYYENVFIARQDITPAQVDALSDAFSKIIVDGGGNVTKKEDWGLRTLAYKIKKNRKGYYVLMNIDAPSGAVHELERQLRLNEDVLRYLTLRVDELEEGPTLMAQNKAQVDERPRRSQTPNETPPPEKDLKTGKTEKSVEPEKADDTDKTNDSKKAADTDKTNDSKKADDTDKTNDSKKADDTDKADDSDGDEK